MLKWSSVDRRFISGSEEGTGEMVQLAVTSKKIVHISRDCSPDQLRQVADKLEELQGTKKEERPGGVSEDCYKIRKSRTAKDDRLLYHNSKQLGYFYEKPENLHHFRVTNPEGLTPSEAAKIEDLLKRYNFK